jgi:hypothetical protein
MYVTHYRVEPRGGEGGWRTLGMKITLKGNSRNTTINMECSLRENVHGKK